MKHDEFNHEVIAPIVFATAILTLLFFGIIITGKPKPVSKIEKKVPTQEELKKIDQEQNFAIIDGVVYYYSK